MATDKTAILEVLHDAITLAICEEEGHEWRETSTIATTGLLNTVPFERCDRCGKTRTKLFDTDTTGTTTQGFDGTTLSHTP